MKQETADKTSIRAAKITRHGKEIAEGIFTYNYVYLVIHRMPVI